MPSGGQEFQLPRSEVVGLHVGGMSARQLAKRYGCTHRTITARLCKWGFQPHRQGRQRKRGGPLWVSVSGYLTTIDRDRNISMVHRAKWEACNGHIPKGYHVHHRDGDSLNNASDNLLCLSNADHMRIHGKAAYMRLCRKRKRETANGEQKK